MKHPTKISVFACLSVAFMTTNAWAGLVLTTDFSTASTPPDQHRVYETRRDTGWNATTKYSAHIASAWDITGGRLENATANTTSYVESETPAWQWWTNPLVGSSDTMLEVSFDYGTDGADTLTAHFWGVQTGATPTTTNNFITNNQGWANGNSGQNQDVSAGGFDTFNLLDGDTTPDSTDHITGQLNGTGTFTWSVDVSTLGIAGVSTVGDIDGFFFAIAANETGGGTSWVDNLSIVSSVPEPSSLILAGVLAATVGFRRRRRSIRI